MEETLIVEKVIGIYFIFLTSLDTFVNFTQIFWPLTYFIISLYSPWDSPYLLTILMGLFISAHTLGKFLSYKLVNYSIQKSFKATLMALIFGSSIGISLIGIFPSFTGIFIGRLISGISSNSQICVRKLLFYISLQEKSDWPALSLKILWSNRIGSLSGIFLAGFLSNPSFFLPPDSKFSQSRFFLLCLVALLLNISGVLLAFSIDISTLRGIESNQYTELHEKKEEVDKTIIEAKPEPKEKEKFDFNKYIDEFGVIKEESIEESFNAEELKYYSPRHVANKHSCIKAPLSARPEKMESYSPAMTLEETGHVEGVKKTHISFLEEDIEVNAKKDEVKMQAENNKNVANKVGIGSILRFRIVFSCLLALFWESLPFAVIFEYKIENSLRICLLLGLSYGVSMVFKLCIFGKLCRKFSFFSMFFVFLAIFVMILMVLPFFMVFQLHLLAFEAVLALGFICYEVISPIGCILIADSVSVQDREVVLAKNDFFCLFFKIFFNLLPCFCIFFIGSFFYFSLLAVCFFSVLLYSLKIKNFFEFLLVAPYKI